MPDIAQYVSVWGPRMADFETGGRIEPIDLPTFTGLPQLVDTTQSVAFRRSLALPLR